MEDTKPISVIEKLKLLPAGTPSLDDHHDDDDYQESNEYRAFANLRQRNRRAEMLELVFKDGKRVSFAYSHLYRITYNPETGLVLYFSEHSVTVQGLRLLSGYRRLLSHRVVGIYEADSTSIQLSQSDESVVNRLAVSAMQSEFVTG